jgi:hypothetical protein
MSRVASEYRKSRKPSTFFLNRMSATG